MHILSLIEQYELQFSNNNYFGDIGVDPSYSIVEGSLPVLVSAPHAINHFREHAVKPADMYTGSLALLLQKLTNCYCIYSNSFSKEDPNYILGGEYKAALRALVKEHRIQFVIDLHGASKLREFDIDLGTLYGTSIRENNLNDVIGIFNNNGITNVRQNHTFSASHPGTITSYCAKELLVQSIQIEINRNYRNPNAFDLFQKPFIPLNKSLNYWAVSDIIIEQTFTILDKQSLQPREEITMNSEELKELGLVQHIFVDLTAENGVKVSCLILSADEVPRGTIQLSKRAKDKLGDCLTTGLTITKPEYDTVLRGIPKVDEIAKPYVKACPALVRKYTNQVELINPKNGFRVNLTLREDSTAKPNTLYFNRYIMLLLETHSEGHDPLIITRARTRSQPKPGIHKLINQLIQRPLSALGNFLLAKESSPSEWVILTLLMSTRIYAEFIRMLENC